MGLDLAANTQLLILVALALAALLGLAWSAARSPFLARLAARNARRRPLRSGLIVFGLMLATTFISGALVLDDTIVLAVKQVAVYSLGRVDEEVVGSGSGLALYPARYDMYVHSALYQDRRVAGIARALAVPDLLVVDESTAQVRGNVLGVGLDPSGGGTLADFHLLDGRPAAPLDTLGPDEIYLNRGAARLLDASPGDTLDLYSSFAPGKRFRFVLRDVVTGGVLAQLPSALAPLSTLQTLLSAPGEINRIYIANTGDGLSGVVYSAALAKTVSEAVPPGLKVRQIKRQGVDYALGAEQLFGRILALYTLFALAIGLLLIFLIFALLAAERRTEIGAARALGMHRIQAARLLLLEGGGYGILACVLGAAAGAALGALIVQAVAPSVAQFGLPLRVDIEPLRLVAAFCLGLLFTLGAVTAAVWTVTRVNVAAALRGLPEPPKVEPSLLALLRDVLGRGPARPSGAIETLRASRRLLWGLCLRGMIPLAASALFLALAAARHDTLAVELAVSAAIASLALLLRWATRTIGFRVLVRPKRTDAIHAAMRMRHATDRIAALVTGVALVAQWSLPFSMLRRFGLPATGGVELFFISGMMLVAGTVLALAPNLDLLLAPLRALVRRSRRRRVATYIALVYPSHQRLRSGLTIAMFSLVTLTMVVMACVAASTTQRYGNVAEQSAGYDIIGQPLFKSAGDVAQVTAAIHAGAPAAGADLAAVSRAQPLPLIMLQPGVPGTRWGVYPAAAISGAFLDGEGLPLVARAPQYPSDAALWSAVRTQPGLAVIDLAALDIPDLERLGISTSPSLSVENFVAPPIASGLLGLASLEALLGQGAALQAQNAVPPDVRKIISDPSQISAYALHLSGVVTGPGTIAPTPLWIADPRGGPPTEITVVGIVDNVHGQRFGLLASADTFTPVEQTLAPFAGDFYFFKLHPGSPVHSDALAIGSALLADGFQTTVIADALIDENAPQVFASRVLSGLVALALLVGMVALAVTGTRAVVERRQQIGVLRALGFQRRGASALFAVEAVVIALVGAGVGLALGLALARNVVAVSLFAQFQAGLTLVVPWLQLASICLLSVVVAVLAALAPAAQAARVAPADALRYE